jgi:hypothetical protein
MTDVYGPLGKTVDLWLIRRLVEVKFATHQHSIQRVLPGINDFRILIDVEQLTIEHSRISLSAEAMP